MKKKLSPFEKMIKQLGRGKTVSIIIMVCCVVLCALSAVYLPIYFRQNNWPMATLLIALIALCARDIFFRYQIFKALGSIQTLLKKKGEQWFINLLERAIKDCQFDETEKSAMMNCETKSQAIDDVAVFKFLFGVGFWSCLFWLAVIAICIWAII